MRESEILTSDSVTSDDKQPKAMLPHDRLTVIKPVCDSADRSARLDDILMLRLRELESQSIKINICERASELSPDMLVESRLLFAVSLTEAGVNMEYYRLLEYLRSNPDCLSGSVGGIIVDGGGEFYTKAIARRFAFSANSAGCSFPGKPLVEATGSLGNFHVLSDLTGEEPELVYRNQMISLIDKVLQFDPAQPAGRKKILAVHASTRRTSNTLLLWDKVLTHLQNHADVTEVSLRNGEIYDCRGCSYEACLHFGENESCFYGGVITEQAFPALIQADILVLICPNYNDAVSANITAFINRMTSIFRSHDFSSKRIYAIIVSGYSGGDIIAEQIIGALSFNKSFILPAGFAMIETANDPQSILQVQDIDSRACRFANNILTTNS